MHVARRFPVFIGLCLLVGLPLAHADGLTITWPAGWEIQTIPPEPDDSSVRQRAVKNDANGDPQMVMELTQSTLTPEHKVKMEAVLLQINS